MTARAKILLPICLAVLCGCSSHKLPEHPRLLATDATFSLLETNPSGLHTAVFALARQKLHTRDSVACVQYQKDRSGKRILEVSREALSRIFYAAYAYRCCGEEGYLRSAEREMLAVCRFPDWNPSHFLDCAEMATAVSIGYDWLCPDLPDSTRRIASDALKRLFFEPSHDERYGGWRTMDNNWAQVCNGALICASIALYDENPALYRKEILEAVERLKAAGRVIYGDDGVCAEGPVYWNYGNMYQALAMGALEEAFGSDFGILADTPGLALTPDYITSMTGTCGLLFNYGDNLPERISFPPLWYYAGRLGRTDILEGELELLSDGKYFSNERLLPYFALCAARLDPVAAGGSSSGSFVSRGKTPLAVFSAAPDLYLAAKGGSASDHHAHADAGSFVFDAWGTRWAADPARQTYTELEKPLCALGGNLWDKSQESLRWRLFRYSCRRHNVLLVNGRDIDVAARVPIVSHSDSSATFDMTSLYWGDLSSAVRTVSIESGEYLSVTDSLCAPSDRGASVRFTLVTTADPALAPGRGIILHGASSDALFCTEGADVKYEIYSSDPRDCPDCPTSGFELPMKERICGFSFSIAPGKKAVLRSTIKKNP